MQFVTSIYKLQAIKVGLRKNSGIEFDLIEENNGEIIPYEIKSSQTVNSNFFKNFTILKERETNPFCLDKAKIIYAGKESQKRSFVDIQSWREL